MLLISLYSPPFLSYCSLQSYIFLSIRLSRLSVYSYFGLFSSLKIEAVLPSETYEFTNHSTCRHNLEDHNSSLHYYGVTSDSLLNLEWNLVTHVPAWLHKCSFRNQHSGSWYSSANGASSYKNVGGGGEWKLYAVTFFWRGGIKMEWDGQGVGCSFRILAHPEAHQVHEGLCVD